MKNIIKRLSTSPQELDLDISGPSEVTRLVHIDSDFNWNFEDSSVDSSSIFEKIRIIGKGGFGTVVELLHKPSGLNLAGKMLSKEMVSRATKESLKKEIDLMKKIRTPYTISYYGNVEFEGAQTLLMEFCKCGSLRDIMDDNHKPLNEIQIKCVMHDLLNALRLLHKGFQIIHRDIKAGNILLSKNGRLKVSDFGVSRQFSDKKTFSTTSTVGTPYWMAPEIINGLKYSFPADIWSVGATAIELFESSPPYSEYPVMKAMILIATQGFQGFRENSKPTPEFDDFIRKCMVPDPTLRATVDELLSHPFLKDVEDIDRDEVFKELLTHEIVYHIPNEEEEEEEDKNTVNPDNNGEEGNKTTNLDNNEEEEVIIIEEEEEEETSDDNIPNLFNNRTIQISASPIGQETKEQQNSNDSNNDKVSDNQTENVSNTNTQNEPIKNIAQNDADVSIPNQDENENNKKTNQDENENIKEPNQYGNEKIKKSTSDIINNIKIQNDPRVIYAIAGVVLVFSLIFGGKAGLFSSALLIGILYYVINYRM